MLPQPSDCDASVLKVIIWCRSGDGAAGAVVVVENETSGDGGGGDGRDNGGGGVKLKKSIGGLSYQDTSLEVRVARLKECNDRKSV